MLDADVDLTVFLRSPVITRLATSFITGGVIGLTGGMFGLETTFLARISHPNDKKCARKAFAKTICFLFAKGLIFCARYNKRAKLWPQIDAAKAVF